MTADPADRLQAVTTVLARLAALDLPPEAQRLLAEARALCHATPPDPALATGIDPDVLDRVLVLVDPSDAQTLLERLQLDLMQCRDGLTGGVIGWDWPRLRLAAHNLVSLSGTAGADPLRRDALALVAWCDDQDKGAVAVGLPHILRSLSHLLDHLKDKAARLTGGAP